MKHVTINLEDNKIEFYNTILGKETIKVIESENLVGI